MTVSPRHPNLFSPGTVGSLRLKNRLVMAPMVTQFASDTGAASPVLRDFLAERARGGVGLIVVEATYVDPLGKAFASQLGIDRDSLLSSHVQLTEEVHRFGARVAVQLHHGGNKAISRFTGHAPVAPSPVDAFPPVDHDNPTPVELATEDIANLVERFGEAAERAQRAGYDAVEIHGAHGYLLHQFLSPASNHRTDEYGGSVANRLRFTLDVIRRVRRAVGPSYPIIYRLSSEGGYGLEDTIAFAKEWEAAGVDALHVSIGGTAPTTLVPPGTSPMSVRQGYLVDYAQAVRRAVNVPIIAVGEIREPAFAEDVLAQGKADYIALGRQLVCDPDWGAKAAQGLDDDVLRCISCDHCRACLSDGTPIRCLINPRAGREGWLGEPEPAATARKVMIVGSGPAGMETARVAALRGHNVSLYESEPTLGGGQLALTPVAPFKEKLGWFSEHLRRQLAPLPIEVHLKSPVDASTVESEAPQVLVVATGASPLIPEIPGIDGDNVVTAHDILRDETAPTGKRVVVLGGRQVGCETAEHLALRDNTVTVVARSPASQLVDDAPGTYRSALLKRLRDLGVEFITEHDVREIRRDGLTLVGPDNAERALPAGLVVIARGAASERALADEAGGIVDEIHVIGDSMEPRTIAEAMYEGTLLGRQI